MGAGTSALFVEQGAVDELLERILDGLAWRRARDVGTRIEFELASSPELEPDVAVAAARGWTMAWDSSGRFLARHTQLAELARDRRVLAIALGGAGSFGFALYQNQKCVRRLLYSAEQSSESIGAPLSIEKKHRAPGVDEAFVWMVLKHVTGLDRAQLSTLPFERVWVRA
jgi:hypothetical protein